MPMTRAGCSAKPWNGFGRFLRLLYPAYNALHGRHAVNEVATIPHTAGIRDAGTFSRQIMKLMQKPIEAGGPRRVALMLAYAAFGLATLFGALSLRANAARTSANIYISCRPVAEHPGMTPGHLVSGGPPAIRKKPGWRESKEPPYSA
jgi:hypothetical protein